MPKHKPLNDIDKFFGIFKKIVEEKELLKLTFSKSSKANDLKNIIAKIIKIKSQYLLNVVFRHTTKDITKNYPLDEGIKILQELYNNHFQNADLYGTTANYFLKKNKKGKTHFQEVESITDKIPCFEHNKNKKEIIEVANNIYLKEVGICNALGEVKPDMYHKFRQLNKYIELLMPALKAIKHTGTIHITDMGSGKGYLTFALYDYLTNMQKKSVRITGVENNAALVNFCNELAVKCGFNNLGFIQGSIEKTVMPDFDILIALHACDTATDEAIFRGIKANASLIVCAPCCHKQIRKEIAVKNQLYPLLKHGIFMEREAEMITDTLRVMWLEAFGYNTRIVEFIETEHTPKNILIIAQKHTTKTNYEHKVTDIEEFKKFFGIKYVKLESLLFP